MAGIPRTQRVRVFDEERGEYVDKEIGIRVLGYGNSQRIRGSKHDRPQEDTGPSAGEPLAAKPEPDPAVDPEPVAEPEPAPANRRRIRGK